MYTFGKPVETSLRVNESYEGETIEATMRKIMLSGQPIQASTGNSLYYDENGEIPFEVNVRTDRFDKALELQTKAREVVAKGGVAGPKGEASSDQGGAEE